MNVLKKNSTLSDLPRGSKKKQNKFIPSARKVAGCVSLLYFQAPASNIAIMIPCEMNNGTIIFTFGNEAMFIPI